jgi:hypothetical protein
MHNAWRQTHDSSRQVSCRLARFDASLRLRRELIKDTFEHVVSQIRALVSDQISAVEEKEGKLPKVIKTIFPYAMANINIGHYPRWRVRKL